MDKRLVKTVIRWLEAMQQLNELLENSKRPARFGSGACLSVFWKKN
jgi:hypothetical protein